MCYICEAIRPYDPGCPYSGTAAAVAAQQHTDPLGASAKNARPRYPGPEREEICPDDVGYCLVADPVSGLGPLIDALSSWLRLDDQTLTYSFAPTGAAAFNGGNSDVSSTTTGWSAEEAQMVRAIFDQVSAFVPLTFVEVAHGGQPHLQFQKADEMPGNLAGYATYPNNNGIGTVVVRSAWVGPNLLRHEMGHLLGLAHAYDGNAVLPGMTGPSSPGDFGLNTLLTTSMASRAAIDPMASDLAIQSAYFPYMALDIAALQWLYGENTTHAVEDTVYGVRSGIHAIWDAGGHDRIDFSEATLDAVIDLRAATLEVAEGGGGYFSYVAERTAAGIRTTGGYTIADLVTIEDATSGSGNDQLTGNAAANRLVAGLGNDRLDGRLGDDTLYGGDGTDTLIGGDGDDLLFGGATDADLRDVIYGGDGRDTIYGGFGNDEIRGDAGNDLIFGDQGADTLIGGTGNDTLNGGSLGDMLFGGAGDDFLNGGFGFDRLNGGAGADTFFHLGVFDHGSDWIQDYNAAEGDVLQFGNAQATRAQFQINIANTPNAGSADVGEAFVIYRPTGQIIWALVDGAGQDSINLRIGADVFDLLG